MCESPVLRSGHPSSATTLYRRDSRIPLAPFSRRGIAPSMSNKWHTSLIPMPETKPTKEPSFPLNDLPPAVVLGILRNLARTDVKDPVRLGAVSKNCQEAFKALEKSDKNFNGTLKIFRGDYDHFGGFKGSKTRHCYRVKRLSTLHHSHW